MVPNGTKTIQKGTPKSLKIIKKSRQNGTLSQDKHIIPILLFCDRFLVSFWEPLGTHFCTFGSHVAAKRRLKTTLLFDTVFCYFLTHFWRVQTRVWYGIYQSKHVFTLLEKVSFFCRFWPRCGSRFCSNFTNMGAKGLQRDLWENTSKKDPQKDMKINLS